MRARYPDSTGVIDRDGVAIAYEAFGAAGPTIVFVGPDAITDSRIWKAQVPYLARTSRVVTIDPRGNGRSGRPTDPAAYADTVLADDPIAVMDELGIDAAIMICVCTSAWMTAVTAVRHPERVLGIVAVSPWLPLLTPPLPARGAIDFEAILATDEGWAKENRHYWQRDFAGYLEFFFAELLPEAHSSKQWEDGVEYARQSSAEIQFASEDASVCVSDADEARALLRSVSCPVLVIHGDDDRCQPAERAVLLAELTGGERLLIEGAGHLPMAREPIIVNRAIADFVRQVAPAPASTARVRNWTRPASRPRRVLYLSSPIGLGHARRDLAIVEELRRHRPEIEVDWLTQHPVTELLRARGERVHPASTFLANESAHIEAEAGEHDLNAFEAIRRMDEILVANFMVFADVVAEQHYDLWVGDESWEVDHFLHENPELKTSAYAWLTDFVGWLPVSGDLRESELTADYNAEMLDHLDRLPRVRDRSIFVGNPDDVVDESFGPGLPDLRAWTKEHYDFAGYVTGTDTADLADRDALRAEFGFAPGEAVCLVTVGGSGVGAHLLRRVIDAYPEAARRVPGLRMVVVTGPRIDPASIVAPTGVDVHGYLPDLHRRLAACDLAVVQGGLTTTMELVGAGRPFIYVPLRNHFEQNIHVRHRLDNYGAGTGIAWDEATPDRLADAIATHVGRRVEYRPVETGGAVRAATLLSDLF